jgi:aflatoxin B1 aldehyde reductase
MYNALVREVESELLPALKRLNIAFYAYNPLAGGVLTGRYRGNLSDVEAEAQSGRFFTVGGPKWTKAYRDREWCE